MINPARSISPSTRSLVFLTSIVGRLIGGLTEMPPLPFGRGNEECVRAPGIKCPLPLQRGCAMHPVGEANEIFLAHSASCGYGGFHSKSEPHRGDMKS